MSVTPADARAAPRPHPRKIGWFGASAIALGGSNQSLFVIGAVLAAQGSAAIPLLAVGLLLGWMAIPGWIELTLMWPERVGGIAAVCAEAFRPYSAVLGNLTGVCYWWGWVPTCAITATLAGEALHHWYFPSVSATPIALGLVGAMAALNIAGLRWAARAARPLALIAGLLALLAGVLPLLSGSVDWHRAASFHLSTPFHGPFGALTSTMAGLYLIGFAAPAFEAAACHVGEMRDPVAGLPRAMFVSAGVATLYFVVLPVIWLGAIGSGPLQSADLSLVLGPVFAPLFGSLARAAAVWFFALNLLHGTLQPLSGATRTLLQLAEDGLLPRMFARRSPRTDAPWFAILVTATVAAVVVALGAPLWIIAAANLTYLIGICLPSVAVWLMRRDEPERPRPYRAPRGGITLGLIAAGGWLAATLFGFEQYGQGPVLAGLGFAYAGSLGYVWRVVTDRRRAGLPRRRGSLHAKLTGSMLLVIGFDGTGYLLATNFGHPDAALKALLIDIFVGVALLTITVGLVLPGMIGEAAGQIARAADRLATGTVSDLRRAMEALARGDLDAATARNELPPLAVYSRDELGEMSQSFNSMQLEIARIADALEGAREGIVTDRRELQRANEVKSEFLSRVSHELRTPLNAILGFGQLLEYGDLDDEQRRHVEQILRGGEHLLALIDDVLRISSVESIAAVSDVEPVALAALVGEAVAWLEPAAGDAKVTIRSDVPASFAAQANLQQLKQVLLNLLSNAVKYNRAGGHVGVTAAKVAAGRVSITVADDGPGIAPELLDRLFTPFDRLGAERSRIQGTGLGLALTEQLVRSMGGTIDVETELGAGAAFTVTLPEACVGDPRGEEDRASPPPDQAVGGSISDTPVISSGWA